MNARTCSSRSVGGAQSVDLIGISIAFDEARLLHGLRAAGHEPAGAARAGTRSGKPRLRLGVGRRGVGVDAITPLAWLGAQTTTLKLGTAIMQLPGRSPANAAMTAVTLDLLSGGRFLMGLGTSGPQVVEGWHGQEWGKPLGKTREYVEIVRTILRRERLEHHGEHYDIPVQGGTGLGKPLKLMARPLRADIPIYLAAIGPKAVEQTFEIADGWLPIFWSPEQARDGVPGRPRARGLRHRAVRAGDLTDDVESARDALKEYYSFYIGGMGARGKNFYNDLFARYGYEAEAREIQDLFLDGKQREAAAEVPDAFVDEVALSARRAIARPAGRVARVRRDDLLVSTRDAATLRGVAEASTVSSVARRRARFREQRNRDLEDRGARVFRAELAADEASVDRFAEDRRLPERERLEPRERPDVAAAALDVALDELGARRESGLGRDRRRAERAHAAVRLAVRREQVADVGARVADRAHLPVEHRGDPRRLVGRDHHVPEPVVAVHDGRREGSGTFSVRKRPTSSTAAISRVWLISHSCAKRFTCRSR